MLDGEHRPASPQRLPFSFQAHGGLGRLTLVDLVAGPLVVDRLELDVANLGSDPDPAAAERFQRRRTRLRSLVVRITSASLDERIEQVRRQLAGIGVTQVSARLNDGFISLRARAADGLAAADVSFRIQLVNTGAHLRALASTVRVHGHLPTPGPVIADRIAAALLGATESAGVVERPHARGLCDIEIDLVGGLLWYLMPPSGWRLPAVASIELTSIKIGRAAIEIAYGPVGARTGELGVRPAAHQLASAHDLMHSVDQHLRDGHLEDGMRGYRALLASGGPDQPLLLERILALASARPAWFFDGLELSRQALGRWPSFPPAHAALASIMLAQGDAREAASHLTQLAQLASGDGDDDQAALAALAGARLLRVLEPKAATPLYQLALEHDPGSAEAADSLVDRLADEQRWPELVRLVRARAVIADDPARAVQLRIRLADVFVHQLGDPASAQQELAAARVLAPDDPAVHEMTATILASSDPAAAVDEWRAVARLAELRGDHRTAARAWAGLGDLRGKTAGGDRSGAAGTAGSAWRRALELDPLQADALSGLAAAAALASDHATAVEMYERLRGLGLPQHAAARYELQLARSLVALGRTDEARSSLRRATLAGGETAAEAHAVLAEIADATLDREHAAAELDTAIASLVGLAGDDLGEGERLYTRAAQLAIARASLLDRAGQAAAASAGYQRAHELAAQHAPEIARDAARTLLGRAGDDAGTERRWIDAVLATRPPAVERAVLLVRRADVRRREHTPDIAAAIADLHDALRITENLTADESGVFALDARRRAYTLEAELLGQSGDRRARAQALASLARIAERAADRVEVETSAAAAWLAADEPAAALPHAARALAELDPDVPAPLRREVLLTLGEAAWRQRAWPDVIRAYQGLIDDRGVDQFRVGMFRHRLAVAADRTGDSQLALTVLHPLVVDPDAARAASPELRGLALRLYADLAERAGDLAASAGALESFAALAPMSRDPAGARPAGEAPDASATARADAIYRAGELFRRADRADDAIRCLEAALRISDSHLPALDALETAWRERGDLERVAAILGRKVAATARHPARQKPLLSRLGDLQAQLGRPDVALATHQRALEIDPGWRPSLRFATLGLRDAGQVVAAAAGLAQLAGELPGDPGVDLAVVARERQLAANELAKVVTSLDDAQLDAVREVALPALERAALDVAPRAAATATDDRGPVTAFGDGAADVAAGLARLRGEVIPRPDSVDEDTNRGRAASPAGAALSLRDAAVRARAAGKLDDAFATLETANHVNPGDPVLLRELIELATQLGDHAAAARHLTALSELVVGPRRGDVLLELADVYYDRLEDQALGRTAMRAAADAFGTGARRQSTLRMLATEAASHLAWDVAVASLSAIAPDKRTQPDLIGLASALRRQGRDLDAIALIAEATASGRFADDGELLGVLHAEVERKAALAKLLEHRAETASPAEAADLRAEARGLRDPAGPAEPGETVAIDDPDAHTRARTKTDRGLGAIEKPPASSDRIPIGAPGEDREPPDTLPGMPAVVEDRPREPAIARIKLVSMPAQVRTGSDTEPRGSMSVARTVTERHRAPPDTDPTLPTLPPDDHDSGFVSVVDPSITSAPPTFDVEDLTDDLDVPVEIAPSVIITGSAAETALAVAAAAMFADRDRLLAARREHPGDPALLLAVLAHLGDREPALRREVLEEAARTGTGRALAIALHELAMIAREHREPSRAAALWTRAYETDPGYAPVWMMLADALAAADDLGTARDLYDKVAASPDYDATRRAFAAGRAEALGHDESIVSGEIKPRVTKPPRVDELASAQRLASAEDWPGAIAAAERAAATAADGDARALELLEKLYFEAGDVTAASEAIGRQLLSANDAELRARLWRRRARLYRDSLGRDAEAYRCLKEAQACSPADPEIAYQLRVAAIVRDEWALAASLLYREIAASANPRDRGALHLELALIYEERLDDDAQAQVNYEQALAFDPTIPAAKLPLARRYDVIGRHAEAARLYEETAATARAGDRPALLAAAARARAAATDTGDEPDLAAQLERAAALGDLDAALALAHELWRREPGHAAAFRVLANLHRTSGDLPALTELTSVRAGHAEAPDERATAWLEVARLAEELGKLDRAARAYDLALIEDPGHVGALDARGALAFRTGDFATADLIYRDLASGESVLGDDELALRRSIIAEQLGRDGEALDHARNAAAVAPGRRDVVLRVQEIATRIGDLRAALDAARTLLDLVPFDDDEAQLATLFAVVDLQRRLGDLDGAIGQLERVLRDHPVHAAAIEMLADLHVARGDWTTAARYLYLLVPLAPTPPQRADRLYQLGEAVLVHLGDVDRADDVFLRASDLDPSHVPTLRRLLDVYWRADDPGALVEVATELADKAALGAGTTPASSLAHALVAAALVGDTQLAQRIDSVLGDDTPRSIAGALVELTDRDGRLTLARAATAILELAHRGLIDLVKLRAAAEGTPAAGVLARSP